MVITRINKPDFSLVASESSANGSTWNTSMAQTSDEGLTLKKQITVGICIEIIFLSWFNEKTILRNLKGSSVIVVVTNHATN